MFSTPFFWKSWHENLWERLPQWPRTKANLLTIDGKFVYSSLLYISALLCRKTAMGCNRLRWIYVVSGNLSGLNIAMHCNTLLEWHFNMEHRSVAVVLGPRLRRFWLEATYAFLCLLLAFGFTLFTCKNDADGGKDRPRPWQWYMIDNFKLTLPLSWERVCWKSFCNIDGKQVGWEVNEVW